MHFVGIDWADEKHQVVVLNLEGKVVSEWEIDHNWRGFKLLDQQLAVLSPVQINIERADGLLVDWLVAQQYLVFVTAPRAAASYRPRHSKDDKTDARLLANLLRTQNEECRPLIKHSDTIQSLHQLIQALDQIQREIVRNGNQLRQVLKQYYPVAITLFSDLTLDISLSFIKTYPTPELARSLTIQQLETFLKNQRYTCMRRLSDIYQKLQAPAPSAQISVGYQYQTLGLVAVLRTLNEQHFSLKRAVKNTYESHPESCWWSSLPGAGEFTAPRLLALFGDNRDAFPSPTMLQALAGTVPVTRRSGKQKIVKFRWACNKSFRRAITDLARNSISKSSWAHSYYFSQLQRGHNQQRAYRALANRWIRILWTLWQRREVYDELKHVANRSRNGIRASA